VTDYKNVKEGYHARFTKNGGRTVLFITPDSFHVFLFFFFVLPPIFYIWTQVISRFFSGE